MTILVSDDIIFLIICFYSIVTLMPLNSFQNLINRWNRYFAKKGGFDMNQIHINRSVYIVKYVMLINKIKFKNITYVGKSSHCKLIWLVLLKNLISQLSLFISKYSRHEKQLCKSLLIVLSL